MHVEEESAKGVGDIRGSGVQGESGGMEAFCSANVMNAVVFDD